jgi:hypothetical protein
MPTHPDHTPAAAGAARTSSEHAVEGGHGDQELGAAEGEQPPEGRHVDQLDRGEDHDPAERRRRDARQEGVREQQDHQHGGRHGQ